MTTMAASEFTRFGTSHWVMLAIFVAGIWPVVRLGRSHRGTDRALRFSRAFALAIPLFTVPMQVVDFLPSQFSFNTTLPSNCATSPGSPPRSPSGRTTGSLSV